MSDRTKTAVLVVHGIGQQMPMDTLRSFVMTTFRDEADPSRTQILNRMDRYSSFLDLRTLVIPAHGARGKVDFYELYWAPTLSGGSAAAVLLWALKTLVSRPRGRQMKQILLTMRLAIVVSLLVSAALYYLVRDAEWLRLFVPLLPLVLVLKPVVRGIGTSVLTETLADASRWFAPSPKDIPERDRIRRLGLDLLAALHGKDEDGKQKYGRIVVVGHSLGSVIAYDIIRLAYDQLRQPDSAASTGDPASDQPAAWHFDFQSRDITNESRLSEYQHFQRQLHAEQRSMGVPWLVTDLITLGSPITHAHDLWTSKTADFATRRAENEYPSCPPIGEFQHSECRRARRGRAAIVGADSPIAFYRTREEGPLIAHEASPFASTRWTNLYFPMTWWLAGDPVGGPLRDVVGPGVRDLPVQLSTRSRRRSLLPVVAHTWYWRRDPKLPRKEAKADDGHRDAVLRLKQVIDLDPGGIKPFDRKDE